MTIFLDASFCQQTSVLRLLCFDQNIPVACKHLCIWLTNFACTLSYINCMLSAALWRQSLTWMKMKYLCCFNGKYVSFKVIFIKCLYNSSNHSESFVNCHAYVDLNVPGLVLGIREIRRIRKSNITSLPVKEIFR